MLLKIQMYSPKRAEGAGGPPSAKALNAPCSGPLGPPRHADMKRGSRSRAGQSAAEGRGAKRWPERDREPLFPPRARKRPPGPDGQGSHFLIKARNTMPASMANPRAVFAV